MPSITNMKLYSLLTTVDVLIAILYEKVAEVPAVAVTGAT
jgi:hypothetical protein